MTYERNDIERAVQRIWEEVQDKLGDVLYDNKIEPTDSKFERAVILWLGNDSYDAFLDTWQEDQ